MCTKKLRRTYGARLDQVLGYVWAEWGFEPAKLATLRDHLLTSRLLKVEHVQREDDYLGPEYALVLDSCISLGLPNMPQGTPPPAHGKMARGY
jgi:hypothetical protein